MKQLKINDMEKKYYMIWIVSDEISTVLFFFFFFSHIELIIVTLTQIFGSFMCHSEICCLLNLIACIEVLQTVLGTEAKQEKEVVEYHKKQDKVYLNTE